MKLQQLRYAVETFRRNLNVSEAAEALFTSQPGVSKQIRLLEEEIGTPIFIRSGKRMVAVTQAGAAVLETAERILRDVQKIKHIGSELGASAGGTLTVAATYSHTRFRLPETVSGFMAAHPQVHLHIRQGTPEEVAEMVYLGAADLALTSEQPQAAELKSLMCGAWHYALLLPDNHILAQSAAPTLEDLTLYPLITYDYALNARSVFGRAFTRAGLVQPQAALACGDNDVLKTYVRLGLGIGLLDKAACETDTDGLTVRDISHLFEPAYTRIVVRSDVGLRGYAYDFIGLFAPELSRDRVDRLLYAPPADDFSI